MSPPYSNLAYYGLRPPGLASISPGDVYGGGPMAYGASGAHSNPVGLYAPLLPSRAYDPWNPSYAARSPTYDCVPNDNYEVHPTPVVRSSDEKPAEERPNWPVIVWEDEFVRAQIMGWNLRKMLGLPQEDFPYIYDRLERFDGEMPRPSDLGRPMAPLPDGLALADRVLSDDRETGFPPRVAPSLEEELRRPTDRDAVVERGDDKPCRENDAPPTGLHAEAYRSLPLDPSLENFLNGQL
jgi:hypothetical protein